MFWSLGYNNLVYFAFLFLFLFSYLGLEIYDTEKVIKDSGIDDIIQHSTNILAL